MCRDGHVGCHIKVGKGRSLFYWVAVEEVELICRNGCIYIYIHIGINMVSPMQQLKLSPSTATPFIEMLDELFGKVMTCNRMAASCAEGI